MSTSNFMVFVVFCRWYVDLMSILVEYMLSLCRRHQTTCIDFISTQIFVSTWCRQKSRQKVDKNQQKSTKIDKKSTKINQNRPKLVDTMSTNDIRTTQGARETCVFFKSFFVDFMSTKWLFFVDFLSIFVDFGWFLSILVDKKSTKIDKNRPKSTKIDQNRQKVDKK